MCWLEGASASSCQGGKAAAPFRSESTYVSRAASGSSSLDSDAAMEVDSAIEQATLQIGLWSFHGELTVINPAAGGTLSNSIVRRGHATKPGLKEPVMLAVKTVTLDSDKEDIDAIRREQHLLKDLGDAHPHVLCMLHFEETPSELVMLTRFASAGDLSKRVPRHACLEEAEARNLTRQTLSALAFLHESGIIHGDVKPENIFLTEAEGGMTTQLADFGFSRQVPAGRQFVELAHVQGSHGYIPAEVIHRRELYFSSDLFALGVMVFNYLGGYEPFYPASKVLDPLLFDEASWRQLSGASRDFVTQVLAVEPLARGDAYSLLEHAWMSIPAEALATSVPGRMTGVHFHDLSTAFTIWQGGRDIRRRSMDVS